MKAKQITTFICGFLIGITLLVALMITVIYVGDVKFTSVTEITTAELLDKITNGEAKELVHYPNKIELTDNNCCVYFAKKTSVDDDFIKLILTETHYRSIPIRVEANEISYFWNFVINWIPISAFAVTWASLFAVCFQKLIRKFPLSHQLK